MSDFAALATWLQPLVQRLSPQAQAQMMRRVAIELRKRNQQRTRSQVDTDGQPFVPRKSGDGQPMFRELTLARHFKTKTTTNTAQVGFAGAAARIASVHNIGRTDVVNKTKGIRYAYPRRQLLGISEEDRAFVEQVILDSLSVS